MLYPAPAPHYANRTNFFTLVADEEILRTLWRRDQFDAEQGDRFQAGLRGMLEKLRATESKSDFDALARGLLKYRADFVKDRPNDAWRILPLNGFDV
jgi:hypothetical protein